MHGRLLNQLSQSKDELVKDFRKRYNTFNDHLTDKITEDQFKDLTSHDLKRIKKVMAEHEEMGQRLRLKLNEQEKHVLGSEQYVRHFKEGYYPSYFSSDTDSFELYEHILGNMNMGKF